jgi:hypothetical protein
MHLFLIFVKEIRIHPKKSIYLNILISCEQIVFLKQFILSLMVRIMRTNSLKAVVNQWVLILTFTSAFFFTTTSLSAQITSTQDGPWDDGNTWVGGIAPGSGDNVIVAHNVSVSNAAAACINLLTCPF